ncbi:hypothetical protein K492DRAFT_2998 [Lichtheimia hyalospora FSU 10163]|nr:hypothetical protein K492DRAFT_2998 [Lichtheimia hyalospora FSU 10163]
MLVYSVHPSLRNRWMTRIHIGMTLKGHSLFVVANGALCLLYNDVHKFLLLTRWIRSPSIAVSDKEQWSYLLNRWL